jgi:hypothetical protein
VETHEIFAEYRRKVAAGEIPPPQVKTPWEKLREKATLKRAINAKCHECLGWGEHDERPAGVREGIRDCTAKGCPLWGFRPYTTKVVT